MAFGFICPWNSYAEKCDYNIYETELVLVPK
jgi:hypothetical protein